MRTIWKYTATISFVMTAALLGYVKFTDPVMHILMGGDILFGAMIFMGLVSVYFETGLDFLKRIGYDERMNQSNIKTIQITQITKQEDIKCLQKPRQNQQTKQHVLIGQPLKQTSTTVSVPLS